MSKHFYPYVSIFIGLLLFNSPLQSQSVGINTTTPNNSAALDITSITKGILIPRLKTVERLAITMPAEALMVFDRDTKSFWYYKLSAWHELKAGAFENSSGTVRNAGNTAIDDFVFGATALPPSTNITDNLFFFDKSKAAFRTGNITNGTTWAETFLGQNSFATGSNTMASGENSVAMGLITRATGFASTALGVDTYASMRGAVALGHDTEAAGEYSLATGKITIAYGDFSATFGKTTYAFGEGSAAFGLSTNSEGDYSAAFGQTTTSSGDYSAGFGQTTTSSGDYSAAFGMSSLSSGDYSAAFGQSTISSGNYSIASGQHTESRGIGTFAHGLNAKADAYASMAIGRYNSGGGNISTWVATDPILEIGIGSSTSDKRNGLTMLKNGDLIIGSRSLPGIAFTTDSVMFYDYSKSAFRCGFLQNSKAWAPDSIGSFSFAAGLNTVAKNNYSAAFNYQTRATNIGATAFGQFSHAAGYASFAIGYETLALGSWSSSQGLFTKANAYSSLAIGKYNVGNGDPANWISTDPVFEIGNGTSSSSRKNALTVLKNGSLMVGSAEFPPAGLGTDILMFFNRQTGSFRVGEQEGTSHWAPASIGDNSFAMGYNNLASGNQSSAMGYTTKATALAAFSTGYQTEAKGTGSFSSGFDTKAEAFASAAFGISNVGGGNPTNYHYLDPIFEVGIGTSGNSSNALTILKSGDIGIGDHNPSAFLDINANSTISRPHLEIAETGANDYSRVEFKNNIEVNNKWNLQVRSDNVHTDSEFKINYSNLGDIFSIKGNGWIGINGEPTSDLHLRHQNDGLASGLILENNISADYFRMYISSGSADMRLYSEAQGSIIIGNFNDISGEYTNVSDRRVKSNFEDLHFDWSDFMQLKPLTYQYIADRSDEKSLGMVAQDVQAIYPELVTYHEDADLYHLNYAGFGVVAIKAVQEVYRENLENKDRIKFLEDSNAALRSELDLIKEKLGME